MLQDQSKNAVDPPLSEREVLTPSIRDALKDTKKGGRRGLLLISGLPTNRPLKTA